MIRHPFWIYAAWLLLLILPLGPSHAQILGPRAVLNSNAAGAEVPDNEQSVAMDGDGNAVVVWNSEATLGGTLGSDDDIVFQTSSDRGVSWSTAASLASHQTSDSGQDRMPSLTTDYSGVWMVVWQSNSDLLGTATDFDIFVSRSLDAGQSWSPAAPVNTNATTDSGHDQDAILVTDRDGVWVAVWESRDDLGGTISSDRDILFARSTNDGLSWSPVAALNVDATTDTREDTTPTIATDGNGNWVATWRGVDSVAGPTGTDVDIFGSVSSDGGATWGPVFVVNEGATDTGFDIDPSIATDRAGNWVIAWVTNDDLGAGLGTDRDIAFVRSTDNGATWTSPAPMPGAASDGTSDDASPELRFDGAVTLVMFWESTNTLSGTLMSGYDILTARSADGGASFSAPEAASSGAPAALTGQVARSATDEAGNWTLATLTNQDFPGTNGNDLDLLYFVGTGPDADGDGLADAAEVKLGTDRLDEDTDGDGVCDGGNQVGTCTAAGADNCPFVVNATQQNSDPGTAGDVCQCGNVDGLVGLTEFDVQRVREFVIGRTLSGPFDPDFCDMNADAACDLVDIALMLRVRDGVPVPTFVDACPGFGAP